MKRWTRFGLLLVLRARHGTGVDAAETIPRSVLDQADCVLIIPSVLKFPVGTIGQLRSRRDELSRRYGLLWSMGTACYGGN
jgi:lipid-binding SYLF domain-containing protein